MFDLLIQMFDLLIQMCLGGGNSNIFLFSPLPEEMIDNLTYICKMGWFNHHLVSHESSNSSSIVSTAGTNGGVFVAIH